MPFAFSVHAIAVRYGQTPASVREWPADDFVAATRYYPYTGGGER